jgi:hypothetical protein
MVERKPPIHAPLEGAYGIRTRAAAVRGRCPRPLDECARRRLSLATTGQNRAVLGRWLKRGQKHRADKQQGDPHALDVEGDPRGGVQSEAYRSADPRELVEDDGVVMSGPGGAPQEGESPEERRERNRS